MPKRLYEIAPLAWQERYEYESDDEEFEAWVFDRRYWIYRDIKGYRGGGGYDCPFESFTTLEEAKEHCQKHHENELSKLLRIHEPTDPILKYESNTRN